MPLGQKANHFSRWPLPLTDNFLASFSLGYGQGNQSWVFTGRIDVEVETPILRPPDAKSWLIWKDPDAGKDWGQEEKGTTEDEMVGWHHRLDQHGFGWTPGVGDGQGGLTCCGPWGHKESDTTERLKWSSKLTLYSCVALFVTLGQEGTLNAKWMMND